MIINELDFKGLYYNEWQTIYSAYKTEIDSLISTQFLQEDNWEKGNKQLYINQYWLLFLYFVLLYYCILNNENKEWSNYISKFDYNTIRRTADANNIDVEIYLDAFGIVIDLDNDTVSLV
jgi:hypothetical protein